jgi:hypothetical protein
MLGVIVLNIVMLNFIMLNVIMLNVIIINVIMLNVIILSAAPCLFLESLSSPALCLRVRQEPTRVEHHSGGLVLPTNTRLGWEGLPGTNALAYSEHS